MGRFLRIHAGIPLCILFLYGDKVFLYEIRVLGLYSRYGKLASVFIHFYRTSRFVSPYIGEHYIFVCTVAGEVGRREILVVDRYMVEIVGAYLEIGR